MPRLLLLLRHAQSAEKQLGQADKDRKLTPLGVREAHRIGDFIKKEKIYIDTILTSTADRAKDTARLIVDAMKVDPEIIIEKEEIYEASTRTFLDFLTKMDNSAQTIICIGHNPVLSYLAEYVTKAEIGNMVPAGLVIIKFNINSWEEVSQGNGELIHYIYPELLSDH